MPPKRKAVNISTGENDPKRKQKQGEEHTFTEPIIEGNVENDKFVADTPEISILLFQDCSIHKILTKNARLKHHDHHNIRNCKIFDTQKECDMWYEWLLKLKSSLGVDSLKRAFPLEEDSINDVTINTETPQKHCDQPDTE